MKMKRLWILLLSAIVTSLAPWLYGAEPALEKRLQREKDFRSSSWFILPHRPNYFLPFTYNTTPNEEPVRQLGSDAELDKHEVKYQLSFKVPAWDGIFQDKGTLYLAYTQVVLWQAYNGDESSPFRDTNYEPEIFYMHELGKNWGGLTHKAFGFGFAHQSNGRGLDVLSRSWNRIYANFIFGKGPVAFSIKPWWRTDGGSDSDNNPNIEKYMGYGEFRAITQWNNHIFSLLFRNNLRDSDNKGAIELNWSFPLTKYLKGYVQFFNGYGETLLDYNKPSQRLGVGFLLADWL